MATEYLDKAGLQKLVQLIQAMPDDATLEFVDGKLQVKSPLSIQNGGTGANTADGVLSNLGIEDKVVAEGTSGNWRYVKYESGYAVIEGKTLLEGWDFSNTKKYGNLYLAGLNNGYNQVPEEALPFPLIEVYYINAFHWFDRSDSKTATSGITFVDKTKNFDAKKEVSIFPNIILARPGIIKNVDIFVCKSITGRWK